MKWEPLSGGFEINPWGMGEKDWPAGLPEQAEILIYGSRVAGNALPGSDLDVGFMGCSRFQALKFLAERVRLDGKAPLFTWDYRDLFWWREGKEVFLDTQPWGDGKYCLPGQRYRPVSMFDMRSWGEFCQRPDFLPESDPCWLSTALRMEALGLPTPPTGDLKWHWDWDAIGGRGKIKSALAFRARRDVPDSDLVRIARLLLGTDKEFRKFRESSSMEGRTFQQLEEEGKAIAAEMERFDRANNWNRIDPRTPS